MIVSSFGPQTRPTHLAWRWVAPLLAALLLAACGANVIGEESLPAEEEMAVGESVEVDGGRLRLTFEGVPFDNRCPKDVQCIVAGMAKVSVRAQIEGGEEHTLTLEFGARGPKAVEHEGYNLQLVAVDPYPISTRRIDPEEYRVRLRCERIP